MIQTVIKRQLSFSAKHLKSVSLKNVKGSSSQKWMMRQLTDTYVEKAKMMNYRCRSAFKLIEVDERFEILKPGYTVIDCGASPGSWTQVAVKNVNANSAAPNLARGFVLSIDKQMIYPIEGATIMGNMDFTEKKSRDKVIETLGGRQVNAVLSDMAPKATGVRDLDCENIIHLAYTVLSFAVQVSLSGSSLLVKLWQCDQARQLEADMKKYYSNVKYVKPNSSRSDSAELFLLGRDFKGLVK